MKQRLKTFGRGGVHPDDKKRLAADRPIRNSYFGQRAVIPMGQDGLADEPIGVCGQVITSSRVSGQNDSTIHVRHEADEYHRCSALLPTVRYCRDE